MHPFDQVLIHRTAITSEHQPVLFTRSTPPKDHMTEMAPTERVRPAANHDAEVPFSLLTALPPMHPLEQCGTLAVRRTCTTSQLGVVHRLPMIDVVGKCEVIMHVLDGTWD